MAAPTQRWVVDGVVVEPDDLVDDGATRRAVTSTMGLSTMWWCRSRGVTATWVADAAAARAVVVTGDDAVASSVRARLQEEVAGCDPDDGDPVLVEAVMVPAAPTTGPPSASDVEIIVTVVPTLPAVGAPLVVGRAPWRRTVGPAAGVVTPDDAEAHVGRLHAAEQGWDAVVWESVDGQVLAVDTSAVVIADGDGWYTPPGTDGAPDSAWRAALVAAGLVVERSLGFDDVAHADAAWVVTPWGATHAVTAVHRGDGTVAHLVERPGPDLAGAS